jgi:hypothetical protein
MNSDIESKLNDIRILFQLLRDREQTSGTAMPSQRYQLLCRKMESELDQCIHRLEQLYYTYYIRNRKIEDIRDDTEKTMAMAHKTMRAFLPYMLLYNMHLESNAPDLSAVSNET